MFVATLPNACQWIDEAWNSVSAEMLIKIFNITGIYNKMDGTGIDMIYKDNDCACDYEDNRCNGSGNC